MPSPTDAAGILVIDPAGANFLMAPRAVVAVARTDDR